MKKRLILGTRKGLLLFERQGEQWHKTQQHLDGVPISYAMQDQRTGLIWVCADHGHWGQKLYCSSDDGATLEERPAPKYPEGSTIYDLFAGGTEQPAAVTYLWLITPGGGDHPERLYIGTEPGGLFRSDDHGQSWRLVEGLWNHPSREKNWFGGGRDQAGCCSIIVDPRDSNHLFVGISVGGVYESTDGGETWVGRNKGLRADFLPDPYAEYGHDPHYMLASPSAPDVLWQQNHCGVYRSPDGGRNWLDLSQNDAPVDFGFPIVLDASDAQKAWVIPAVSDDKRMAINGALYVAHTTDGGESWVEQRRGLPQENAYDVVFRHAFDNDGETLIFGSTTGNLFISHNGGENWQTISNTLPPIYSVRLA